MVERIQYQVGAKKLTKFLAEDCARWVVPREEWLGKDLTQEGRRAIKDWLVDGMRAPLIIVSDDIEEANRVMYGLLEIMPSFLHSMGIRRQDFSELISAGHHLLRTKSRAATRRHTLMCQTVCIEDVRGENKYQGSALNFATCQILGDCYDNHKSSKGVWMMTSTLGTDIEKDHFTLQELFAGRAGFILDDAVIVKTTSRYISSREKISA